MSLPTNQDLLKLFSAFLFEAGLSSVSVKNYLSDIRHFLAFSSHVDSVDADQPVRDIFQNLSKYVNLYTDDQKSNYVPTNTINRRLASIRRFSTFLKSTFDISESGLAHNVSSKSSSNVSGQSTSSFRFSDHSDDDPFKKILNQFKSYLDKEKKTHATVKNYLSDINHFISWSANQTPFTSQDLKNIVSKNQLNAYTTYEKLSHTSTSVINRRYSSIKKFAQFAFENNYLPDNPFERKTNSVRLAPLSWLDRLSKTNPNRVDQKQNHSRIQNLYQKYNQLPFTPYLHLAILVLATSAMAIFAYNQIITAAFPSQAAGLPTVPNRQLSFQGRLTDSSSNPITTNVNVTFRLYDALTSGTNLYNSGACS
ncbi:MAG TPA: site-specific integrase, partial [Patescibacteria group bacterium]